MVPPVPVAQRVDGSWINADGGVGVFTEQAVIRESVLARIDADVRPEQAAMLGCGIVSGLGAVLNVAQVPRGATVAVLGCGHLGLWMIQAAHLAGAERIVAIDHLMRRRAAAGRLGATDVVDPAQGDVLAQVRDLTVGRGVDVALEAGGTLDGIEQVFGLARGGGTVVLTSMAQPTDVARFPALEIAVMGKRVLSSQSGGSHLKRDLPPCASM
jgi:S-(hydroxymethyl)glutathione dehydrogenase/alcohol dehydrogenase